MATTKRDGYHLLGMQRDDDGHRSYKIRFVVLSDDPMDDGPETVLSTAGLPSIGSTWVFGNDNDPWAFCLPSATVTPTITKEPCPVWHVDFTFSTKPMSRCNSTSIEDPLAEPDQIGGSFVKYTKEVTRDRFGDPIKTSSHEMIRGAQVEFDQNRPTVWIEQNELTLGLATFAAMVDTVNDATLWGLSARMIKLSNMSWTRKLYGVCTYYYTRRLEFDISYEGFDRTLTDEGTKVLNGHWSEGGVWVLDNIDGEAPNPDNPTHFIRYKDLTGENARVILDGAGLPALTPIGGSGTGTSGAAGEIDIEYYGESNFLLLGVPASL